MISGDSEINELTQFGLMKNVFEKNAPFDTLLRDSSGATIGDIKFPGILYTYNGGAVKQAPAISPGQLVNFLLGRRYTQDINLITHKEISSLVSYIKIMKVPRIVNNKPVRPINLGIKSGVEIPFRTYYNPIFDANNILRDQNGAGIVSLKVDVISNTGAYYKQQVNLKLHFMNASMLGNDPNWKFVLTTPTVDQTGNDVVYGLIFGWAKPDNMPEYEVANAKVLYDKKTAILMNLKKYEISFSQDGSVVVSLDFIGSAEQIAGDNKADIINNETIRARDKAINQEIETERQRLEKERQEALNRKKENEGLKQFQKANPASMYGPAGGQAMPSAEEENRKIDEEYQKKSQAYEDFIKQKQTQASDFRYSEFLTDLINTKRVYSAKISVPADRKDVIVEPIGVLQDLDYSTISSGSVQRPPARDTWTNGGAAKRQLQEAVRQAINDNKDELTDAESTAIRAVASPLTQPNTAAVNTNSPVNGNYSEGYFTFVFVGDIIAKAAKTMYENMNIGQEELKIVLTTFDVTKVDAKVVKEPSTGEERLEFGSEEDGEQFIIDLASFPVAYNLFASWFIKNVVSAKVEMYLFKDFVKEFLNQVVLTSIENYAEWGRKFTPDKNQYVAYRKFSDENIEVSFVDAPYDLTRPPYATDGQKISTSEIRNNFKRNEIVKINDSSGNTTNDRGFSSFLDNDNQNVDYHRYAFIYGALGRVKIPPDTSGGNVSAQKHAEEGIFQFYVGASTGILKEIKFQPINSPERLSAQILNATNDVQGKPSNKTFNASQRYDVNISCVGFHYFQPGQLIFVDTQLLGFGHPNDNPPSVARTFTLGGYFVITKVSHDIETTNFSTSITAKFVDWGERRKGSKSGTATPP